ncbi:MAG TPA: TonB-dependent receptor, partial [Thermoanaerobaculia bacterium]|nr:TonB-dependent receptor [Thermoanaerobaculia bacterium]
MNIRLRTFLSFLITLAMTGSAFAQFSTTGEIFGRVSGPEGERLSGVTVTLHADHFQSKLSDVTSPEGAYRISNVSPGVYRLHFSTGAEERLEQRPIAVRAGSVQRVDYRFEAVSLREEITVRADAPLVETTRSEANKYLGAEVIQHLPLQNRHFLDVLATVPGINRGVGPGLQSMGPKNSFHIHGARANQNQFLFDGVPNNDRSDLNTDATVVQLSGPRQISGGGSGGATFQVGTALQPFSIDAIEQVQLATSLFSAEYGNGSGGVVNVVTRNGSDVPNTSLTLQYQSDDYVKESQQRFDRYQESLTYGGPIVRGRTRLFASFERDDHDLGFD